MIDTLPAWPAGLPVPLRNGYGYQRDDTREMSNPAVGPPRVRIQTRIGKATFTVTFKFTDAQLALFEVFYERTLEVGALHFLMPLKTGTGIINMKVLILKRGKTTTRDQGWAQPLTLQTFDRA